MDIIDSSDNSLTHSVDDTMGDEDTTLLVADDDSDDGILSLRPDHETGSEEIPWPPTTGTSDDDQMELVMRALKACELTQTTPWPPFIVDNTASQEGTVMAVHDASPFLVAGRCIPFPTHLVADISDETKIQLFSNAMSLMAIMPLFTPIPIFVPTLAATLTGKISTYRVRSMKQQENEKNKQYARLLSGWQGDPKDFHLSKEAQKIQHDYIHMRYQRVGIEVDNDRYTPECWKYIQSSVSIFMFYMKTINMMEQRMMFVPDHDHEMRKFYAEKIVVANRELHEGWHTLFRESVLENERFSMAVKNIQRQLVRYGFVMNWMDPEIIQAIREGSVVDAIKYFTVGAIVQLEQWILVVTGIPKDFRHVFISTLSHMPDWSLVNPELEKELATQVDKLDVIRNFTFQSVWTPTQCGPALMAKEFSCVEQMFGDPMKTKTRGTFSAKNIINQRALMLAVAMTTLSEVDRSMICIRKSIVARRKMTLHNLTSNEPYLVTLVENSDHVPVPVFAL